MAKNEYWFFRHVMKTVTAEHELE